MDTTVDIFQTSISLIFQTENTPLTLPHPHPLYPGQGDVTVKNVTTISVVLQTHLLQRHKKQSDFKAFLQQVIVTPNRCQERTHKQVKKNKPRKTNRSRKN